MMWIMPSKRENAKKLANYHGKNGFSIVKLI